MRCLRMDVILLRALVPARMYLPSRYLSMGLYASILNNRGPKIEPCGTPDSMGKSEENFPRV
jgi:hypothetical protein